MLTFVFIYAVPVLVLLALRLDKAIAGILSFQYEGLPAALLTGQVTRDRLSQYCRSGNVLISLSLLKNSFAEHRILS